MPTSYDTPGCLNARIPEYIAFRKSLDLSSETVRQDVRCLRRFQGTAGNILMRSINDTHIVDFLAEARTTRSERSIAVDINTLNGFFNWGRRTRRIPVGLDPMLGRKAPKFVKKEHRRVPVNEFPELLGAAEHPRDRAVISLGLHVFLRSSEIKLLRVKDLGLGSGEMLVTVQKSKRQDLMPIPLGLDEELREWLKFYSWTLGTPLHPDYYVIPARSGGLAAREPGTGLFVTSRIMPILKPQAQVSRPQVIVQRALTEIGFGDTNRQGIHTLRRSGARAWFDYLQRMDTYIGADGVEVKAPSYPIRPVQSALHHAHQQTTETYIGLEPDRLERDALMRGRIMFQYDRQNVIKLQGGESNGDQEDRDPGLRHLRQLEGRPRVGSGEPGEGPQSGSAVLEASPGPKQPLEGLGALQEATR